MRLLSKHVLFFFLLLALFSACGTYSEEEKKSFEEKINDVISENNWSMERLENGLYFQIIEQGEGELIKLTDVVTFAYKGSFIDGEVFQTIPVDDPVTFPVRSLIAGWQDALSLIGNQGKIRIIVPPHLGYGNKETGIIPANSILIYELEVVAIA